MTPHDRNILYQRVKASRKWAKWNKFVLSFTLGETMYFLTYRLGMYICQFRMNGEPMTFSQETAGKLAWEIGLYVDGARVEVAA